MFKGKFNETNNKSNPFIPVFLTMNPNKSNPFIPVDYVKYFFTLIVFSD